MNGGERERERKREREKIKSVCGTRWKKKKGKLENTKSNKKHYRS
jgi:hypothetical protein